jgi:hypothetical protein
MSDIRECRECEDCGAELLENEEDLCNNCNGNYDNCDDPDSDSYLIDGVGFADPGGRSSLRAATRDNPRDRPCPTCGRQNVLTRIDEQRGYQCDYCADQAEMGW